MRYYFKIVYSQEWLGDKVEYFDLYLEDVIIAEEVCDVLCKDVSVENVTFSEERFED